MRAKIKYYWMDQRSKAWYTIREGKWTGSTIIALLRGKTVIPEFSDYDNLYMKRGRMLEPLAIEMYETVWERKVKLPGFVTNSQYPGCGYSPDGLDGNILLEVKCLNKERHQELIKGIIPPEYMAQIQFGLMITGHKWARLIAYNPDVDDVPTSITVKRDMKIRNNIKRKLLEVASTS